MSALKKCCRYCSYYKQDKCTHTPFVEHEFASEIAAEGCWVDDVRAVFGRSEYVKFFKNCPSALKLSLVDAVVDVVEDNIDSVYADSKNILIVDPDNFYCCYWR